MSALGDLTWAIICEGTRSKPGLQSEDKVEELENKLREMERQNGNLKEKV